MRKVWHLKSMAFMTIGTICLLIGLVFLPLPPPFFGMVFIAVGLPLLAAGSKRTRRFIQYMRWRYYRHNAKIEYLMARLPMFLRKHGHKTRPDGFMRSRKMTTVRKQSAKENEAG